MATQGTHTLSILAANKPGVLVRVALVFARRGYNIDSLVVSTTHDQHFSRMTITAKGDPATLEQIIKQVNKLVDVIHASEHSREKAQDIEMALLKAKVPPSSYEVVRKLAHEYHARILDETDHILVLALMDTTERLDAFELVMVKYGLTETVRTGKLLMMKGAQAT